MDEQKKESCCGGKEEKCCEDSGCGCGSGCRCLGKLVVLLVFLVGGIIGYLMGHGCGMCGKKKMMMGAACPMMAPQTPPPAK